MKYLLTINKWALGIWVTVQWSYEGYCVGSIYGYTVCTGVLERVLMRDTE